jgi:hypothetical protein
MAKSGIYARRWLRELRQHNYEWTRIKVDRLVSKPMTAGPMPTRWGNAFHPFVSIRVH